MDADDFSDVSVPSSEIEILNTDTEEWPKVVSTRVLADFGFWFVLNIIVFREQRLHPKYLY